MLLFWGFFQIEEKRWIMLWRFSVKQGMNMEFFIIFSLVNQLQTDGNMMTWAFLIIWEFIQFYVHYSVYSYFMEKKRLSYRNYLSKYSYPGTLFKSLSVVLYMNTLQTWICDLIHSNHAAVRLSEQNMNYTKTAHQQNYGKNK